MKKTILIVLFIVFASCKPNTANNNAPVQNSTQNTSPQPVAEIKEPQDLAKFIESKQDKNFDQIVVTVDSFPEPTNDLNLVNLGTIADVGSDAVPTLLNKTPMSNITREGLQNLHSAVEAGKMIVEGGPGILSALKYSGEIYQLGVQRGASDIALAMAPSKVSAKEAQKSLGFTKGYKFDTEHFDQYWNAEAKGKVTVPNKDPKKAAKEYDVTVNSWKDSTLNFQTTVLAKDGNDLAQLSDFGKVNQAVVHTSDQKILGTIQAGRLTRWKKTGYVGSIYKSDNTSEIARIEATTTAEGKVFKYYAFDKNGTQYKTPFATSTHTIKDSKTVTELHHDMPPDVHPYTMKLSTHLMKNWFVG